MVALARKPRLCWRPMNQISEALSWPAGGFLCAVIFASFFEWTLHRYVMHRPFGKFRYPFTRILWWVKSEINSLSSRRN